MIDLEFLTFIYENYAPLFLKFAFYIAIMTCLIVSVGDIITRERDD